jgi:urease accessory protein
MRRAIEIDLTGDAQLLLAEAVVLGRAGMGEAVEEGSLLDRWRLRRDGVLLHAEAVRLDGAIAARLAQRAVAAGGAAVATVLIVPGDDAAVALVRAPADRFRGEVGVSAWNGLAVVRLCAADGAALRHDLLAVLGVLRASGLPRLWLN